MTATHLSADEREALLRSVLSSLALSGIDVDRERLGQWLDAALTVPHPALALREEEEMSLPEVTPARLADRELATIRTFWAVVEDDAQAADEWRHHTGTLTRMAWRTPDHGRLTRLLAHIAWQAAEIDYLREALAECASEPREHADA